MNKREIYQSMLLRFSVQVMKISLKILDFVVDLVDEEMKIYEETGKDSSSKLSSLSGM